MKDYLQDWRLSLTEYEKGGWGSSLGTQFRVPALYQKNYTTTNSAGVKTYNKDKAFNEIVTLFAHHVFSRYQDLFEDVDLYTTGVVTSTNWKEEGVSLIPIYRAYFDTPEEMVTAFTATKVFQPNDGYSVNPLTSDTIVSSIGTLDFINNSFNFTVLDTPLSTSKGGALVFTSDDWYAFTEHTRNMVKAAIYKGIELASINREFWSLIKDSSFQGQNFTRGDQTSKRSLSYELFINEANTYLESAGLNDYEVSVNRRGEKTLFYKNEIVSYGTEFDWGKLFSMDIGSGGDSLVDDTELTRAELGYNSTIDDTQIKEAEVKYGIN